jgi:hypothetical protein
MRHPACVLILLAALATAGCATTTARFSDSRKADKSEAFDSATTHSRDYPAGADQTCEAARRALLSQGYLINTAGPDQVIGRKNFQPSTEEHVELEFRVVCASESEAVGNRSAVVFVTAVRERYALKKVNNSASVGVGVLGSLSLPISASNDAMVKVASETLADQVLYDRFYTLLDRFLTPQDDGRGADPQPQPQTQAQAPASAPAPAKP